jgi:hypothetical protein
MTTHREQPELLPSAEQEPVRDGLRMPAGEPVLNVSALLPLPPDRPGSPAPDRRANESLSLPPEMADAIECLVTRDLHSDAHALRNVLLATFAVLIHRYSGEEETDLEIVTITKTSPGAPESDSASPANLARPSEPRGLSPRVPQ